jgi:hypothetical protein
MKVASITRTALAAVVVLGLCGYAFAGQTIYVDDNAAQFGDGKSWATAFNYLQDALFNAVPPAEIRVAQGIYKPHLNSYSAQPPSRSDTFQLKNGVTIKGGYAGLGNPDPNARDFELYETILSGDLNGDDVEVDPIDLLDEPTRSENSYNVVTGTGCSRSAILEGFTITGGNANGTLLSDMSGGGIYDGDLTVISCKIVGNSAAGGGGVSCHGGSTLSDCTISGNAAGSGGGLYGVISVVNCTISDNLTTQTNAHGGGINCRDTELVSGCTFINNSSRSGGGLATSYDLPTVVNCRFIGNSAQEGGGVYSGGFSPELTGCVFSGNTADDGGGLYAYEGFPKIVNCTFTHNYSPLGGGMNTPEGGPVVVNCVFWGNRAGEEIRDELAQLGVCAGNITVDYSCVQGWTGTLGGTGNIGDNPLFVDSNGPDGVAGTEDDDLRLQRHSPCIDAGDNTVVPPSLLVDLDHKPRIANHIVDMGAYEKQSFSLSSNFLVVPEGGTAAFTVALLNDPLKTIEVTVVLHSGDGDITIESGHNLFFDSSNYAKPQTVVLAAAEDEDYLNGTAEIWVSGPDLLAAVVIAAEGDNEPVPKILYVDGRATGANDGWNWNDAFTRLQDALAIAAEYPQVKEVRVAGGSYTPAEPFSGDRDATFRIVKGLTMLGSYAGLGAPDPDARNLDAYTTVLSGDLNGNDGPDFAGYEENSYHVITCERNVGKIVVDGFEVRGGNAGFRRGGGINGYYASPTVRNCKFIGNMANNAAAAKLGDATVTDCTFIGNRSSSIAGAIGIGNSNGGTITRCIFISNSAAGSGGGAVQGNQLMVTDCTFIDNSAIDPLNIVSTGGALNCLQSTVINSIFIGNRAERGGAVSTFGGTVIGCTFTENSGQMGALYGSSVTLVNNIFWNNNAGEGPQIGFDDSGLTSSVSFCDVQGGRQGIYVEDQPPEFQWGLGNIDADPRFVDPDGGDNIIGTEDDNLRLLPDSPCINKGDNTAVPPTVLTDLDGNPRIVNGTVDMGAYEFQGIQILYVDADAPIGGDGKSWATAFKHLQDALFNAVSPAEIRVAQGIYKPHLNTYSTAPPSREDTFQLKNGVTIKGGYAGIGSPDHSARDIELYETILSGDLSGNDVEVDDPCDLLTEPTRTENSWHVVIGIREGKTAVIDGFTITGGNASKGAGINVGNSRPLIINCTFEGNSATDSGGAVAICDLEPAPTFINCKFNRNAAGKDGGGLWSEESNPILTDCTFNENWAGGEGGGIYGGAETLTNCSFFNNSSQVGGGVWLDTRATLTNCIFAGNLAGYGGGMYSERYSLTLSNCVFSGNTAKNNGGGMLNSETSTFSNCMFIGNYAGRNGGGIYNFAYCHPTFSNCTFSGNYADGAGGGLYNGDDTGAILTNCILWADTPTEIDLWIGGTAVITYSDVEGGWVGLGNIDVDPCFIDPGYWNPNGTPADANDDFWVDGDYHLSLDSPCIDTGDPNFMAEPNETDLDGNPRVIGGRIDMGAYEFWGPVYIDDDAPNDPGPGDPQVSDPLENGTDARPFDTIQEAINVAKDGYTVLARQGSYFEIGTSNCIDFLGKNITLTSADPTDWDVVNNTIVRGYVQFTPNEGPDCKFTGFRISSLEGAIYGNHTHATISHCNISGNGPCGATVIKDCDGIISNCLITDNTTFFYCGIYPVIFGCNGLIKNCTITNNVSGVNVGTATIENCIIYNNTGSQLAVTNGNKVDISYSNVQDGLAGVTGYGQVNWGPGNIDTDPCFVRLGYWIMDEITLVEGDYHLRSEGWRWNTEGTSWTYDYATSRCVDAGNPGSGLRGELMSVPRDPDNVWGINLRINMGVFGGTSQASMPPHDWSLLADLNNDGTANFVDFAYQAQDWLTIAPEQPGDLNRDDVLNTMDLALFAEEWLKMTVWIE